MRMAGGIGEECRSAAPANADDDRINRTYLKAGAAVDAFGGMNWLALAVGHLKYLDRACHYAFLAPRAFVPINQCYEHVRSLSQYEFWGNAIAPMANAAWFDYTLITGAWRYDIYHLIGG